MELLFGQSLWSVWEACRARGVRLRYDMIAWIGARVADGLHYAHELADDRRDAARHRPPRRQCDEHLRDVRRRHQDHRLRSRQGGQPRVEDGGRHHQGQGRVHVARAGGRRARRPPHGRLRARRRRCGSSRATGASSSTPTRWRRSSACTPRTCRTPRASSTDSRRRSGRSSRAPWRASSEDRQPDGGASWRASSTRSRARPSTRDVVADVMRELFADERARQLAWIAEASAPGGRRVAQPLKSRSTFWTGEDIPPSDGRSRPLSGPRPRGSPPEHPARRSLDDPPPRPDRARHRARRGGRRRGRIRVCDDSRLSRECDSYRRRDSNPHALSDGGF